MASAESSLENLLGKEEIGREYVDFFLQKRRIEDIFDELLCDIKTFGRVAWAYLKKDTEIEKTLSTTLNDVSEDLSKYDSLQKLLRELDEKSVKDPRVDAEISPLVHEAWQKVQNVAEKSLLRPPSPPVVIKNRAEHETFRWARLIALQESQIESLKRKIEEYERKLTERKKQRQDLQLRSKREMHDQLAASRATLAEMDRASAGTIRRLQEELSSEPPLENTSKYLSSLDQADQKRKRIAKLHVQLQLWIKKYDKFIGEPMPVLLELEERMAGLEEWKETVLAPQEERLRELREQIGEYEAVALEEKIQEFRKLHAVRVLQRAWKRTLEIKRSKKVKSKKGKGRKGK